MVNKQSFMMTCFLVPHKVSREMQKKDREDADLRKLAISYSESRVPRHKGAGVRGEGLVPCNLGDFLPTWITLKCFLRFLFLS